MNSKTIPLLIYFMFFSIATSAQKKQVASIDWKIAGSIPAPQGQPKALGFAGPVAGMHNDILIVGGGANFPDSMPWEGGKKKYYDDLFLLRKDRKENLRLFKSFKLPYPIAYGACCSTPLGVVVVGGENENGILSKVLLIKWNKETQTIEIANLIDLPIAVTNASVAFHNNIIYLAGGETKSNLSDKLFSLNLIGINTSWKELSIIPKPLSHSVLTLQSNGDHNAIYLMGGREKNNSGISELYASIYEFDLVSNVWTEKKPLPYELSAGTGIAIGSNLILLFGGDKGETFHRTEELVAAINQEKDEAKKEILNEQKIKLQASHPGFSKDVLLYNTLTDAWTNINSIPFDVPVTTTAIKWNDQVVIPGGEIRAGVRTPCILTGKVIWKK